MSKQCETDCRSDVGITVGLIDALITIARVLAHRDFTPPEVAEALMDLRDDEDLQRVLTAAKAAMSDITIDWVSAEYHEDKKS